MMNGVAPTADSAQAALLAIIDQQLPEAAQDVLLLGEFPAAMTDAPGQPERASHCGPPV